MTTNNRYLDIDENIRVGYNYILSKYYVTNKETTTYRTTVEAIQDILHSLDIYSIQDGVIASFKSSIENLTNIYYTLSNTGSYISTIQFNAFKDYALTLNCEKAKLYIMNSTIIFDLNTKESPKIVRVPKLCSFYKDTIGLEIQQEDMLYIYNYMTSFFNPTCYRQIRYRESMETPLYYDNLLLLSNYNKEAHAVYNLKMNPRNLFIPTDIGSIINIDNNTNLITLTKPIESSIIQKYDIGELSNIIINGTEDTINDVEYSADGMYFISSIKDNIVEVGGTIPISYNFLYPTCSLIASTYTITEMSRENNTITLNATPNDILVGDTINVEGATIETEYETISCNGAYTVTNIQDSTITVQESIPTNYSGNNAILEKCIFISNIKEIQNNIIYFEKQVDITLNHKTIIVYNKGISTEHEVLNQNIETNAVIVESIEDYNPQYPKLQYPVPSSEIMVNVTYVDEDKEDLLPIGEFLLDNPEQAQQYLSNYSWVVVPESISDMTNETKVPTQIPLFLPSGNVTMELQGLYDEVYNDVIKQTNN